VYKIIPIIKAESLIPVGDYCYQFEGETYYVDGVPHLPIKSCPFYDLLADREAQANGYCRYLNKGDLELGVFSLLWDAVKECGINFGEDAYA
jgi:hypothetical protein